METPSIQELTREMEESFELKGLHEQLREMVKKALRMTDEQVRGALAVMRSPLVVVKGRTRNVFGLKDEDGEVPEFIEAVRLQENITYDPNAIHADGVPTSLWRRVVELEALNRELAEVDLSKVMTVIAQKAHALIQGDEQDADLDQADEDQAEKTCVVAWPSGFTAKNAPKKLRVMVVKLRNGGMAFHEIEKQLGLRQVRGMTAHRIYTKFFKKAKKAKKAKKGGK